ncbi:glutathione S-transferase [Xylariaceae sp. FL0255]|nr:glutathione S-transferase [Xylariaceae sp. FL0255]
MSSSLKAIKLYGEYGPNPRKVMMILEELSLPYEVKVLEFSELKQPDYLAINPNGRMPAIYDPNTDLTLWESGAIVEYLIDTYDKDNHKISYPAGSKEAYLTKQWLYFQVSGQGPYYGQAVWFSKLHSEQIPSAVERYVKEINRVTGVVEGHLSKQKASAGGDGPWLVGDKMTYADIAWIMWQRTIYNYLGADIIDYEAAPTVKQWLDKMLERPAVKTALNFQK